MNIVKPKSIFSLLKENITFKVDTPSIEIGGLTLLESSILVSLLKILLKYFRIKFITHSDGLIKINEFQELNSFTDDNRYLICSEHRPSKMRYLYCIPSQKKFPND